MSAPPSFCHGGHPDLREATVAGAGGATPVHAGTQGLANACRRRDRAGSVQHEPAGNSPGPQAVRVRRPRTWGDFGFSIWACLGGFESSDLWCFMFEQAEGGGGCGWQRLQALRLQEVQMLEAVRNLLYFFDRFVLVLLASLMAESVFPVAINILIRLIKRAGGRNAGYYAICIHFGYRGRGLLRIFTCL